MPSGELLLEPAPVIPQPTGVRWQQYLMVLPMLAGTFATAMMFGGREGGSAYTYVVGGIFGLSTLGMLVMNVGGANTPRKAELMGARRAYLRYLSGMRRQVRETITAQRDSIHYRHPEPSVLWSEAMGLRLWERRATDADFGVVRMGLGPQSLATPLVAPTIDPTTDLEPVTAGALHRFLTTYSVVADLPISLAVRAFHQVLLIDWTDGAEGARALARAILGQLVTFHAPDDLVVAACVAPERQREWEWLKWLPHALDSGTEDALGPRRLVATELSELDELLAPALAGRPRFAGTVARADASASPQIVVIVDGGVIGGSTLAGDGGLVGVTLLHVAAVLPRTLDRTTVAFTVAEDGMLRSATADGEQQVGRADALSLVEADALARRLTPLRLSEAAREPAAPTVDHDLANLLGLSDADPEALWASRPDRELLRIPIGTASEGALIHLDLKEAARGGVGPHGMIVGATGSGKSELLRTLVLGLAVTHPPNVLNVVLVDFKGGATFASLDRLPHTSAVITNLADELPLVDRMHDALTGELTRRQELLRRAGNIASLREYDRARAGGVPLPPLPSLLIVCDEFTELLIAKPEFIDMFLQIGRIGRSIGVHLLLATQRLEEGRLRGLEANLSYRIALRTFSALESRTLIGSADAASLPPTPGHGYLAVGTEPPQRFKAAYVSGPYRHPGTAAAIGTAPRMYDYGIAYVPRTEPPSTDPAPVQTSAPSLIDVIVGRLAGHGTPAHRVWLPPLRDPPTLDGLLGGLVTDPIRGVTTADAALRATLTVPVATVDRPLEQRRDTVWLDLSGAAGHVAVAGAPQSGKSTLLRTLVTALALTHTPAEVHAYCLDFGGGALASLRKLPHVGGVSGRLDQAEVRRTVGEVASLLVDRERSFAARGIDSMATLRRRRDAVANHPDVFLVIDGWATVRSEFEDLEPILVDIATRGLSYGVHLAIAATRWYDIRQNLRDLIGSRIELRLGDPNDSIVNRRLAANVPAVAGRGLTAGGLHLLTALPEVTGHPASAVTRAIAEAWGGPAAPAVRMLPDLVPYSAILVPGKSVPVGTGLELPIGIAEADLRPVTVDFAVEPHLLVFGDECGKSSLLRSLAESIVRRFAPREARIILIDYRRSALGAVTTEHLIGYGMDAEHATNLIASAASYLEDRRPGPSVTPEQLRTRSWWDGPELFVLVDDYDLLAGGGRNPLTPLLDHLAQARDVGLHLVLARRAGGAGRALYDPVIQRLRELTAPGLVLSGDPEEGALVGTVRPSPQPAGRGWLVTRRQGTRLVQLAYREPA